MYILQSAILLRFLDVVDSFSAKHRSTKYIQVGFLSQSLKSNACQLDLMILAFTGCNYHIISMLVTTISVLGKQTFCENIFNLFSNFCISLKIKEKLASSIHREYLFNKIYEDK